MVLQSLPRRVFPMGARREEITHSYHISRRQDGNDTRHTRAVRGRARPAAQGSIETIL